MTFSAVAPALAVFDECHSAGPPASTDELRCQLVPTGGTLGNAGVTTPVSYYVPSACTSDNRCPVLYLLHGFGGDYKGMLGTPADHRPGHDARDKPSAWVRALDSGP